MRNCTGFDIGNHAIHIAVNKGGKIIRSVSERLPEGLVQNGRITSIEAMTDVLKELKRKHKLRVRNASVVLPSGQCYCRRFTVAAETKEQLKFNLPYGFHDFITDDKRNYFFDCAVIEAKKNENDITELDVLGAAARKDVVAEYITMFRKAGFALKTIVPDEIAFTNLIRKSDVGEHGHGILDIGNNAVRLYLFNGERFENLRVTDFGCNALDRIIGEHFGVDGKFITATYRETNFENVNDLAECRNVYASIAIEVRKAINFFRFNGGGSIEHLHCCGGGVKNAVLMEVLRSSLPLNLSDMNEFFDDLNDNVDYPLVAAAIGATMQ